MVDSVISKLPYPAKQGVISADLPYEQMKEFQSQLNVLFSSYNPSNPYSEKSQPTITFRSTKRSNGFVAVRLKPYNDIIEINFGHQYDKRRIDYRTIAERRKENETLYAPKSKVDEVNLKISTLTHEYAHVISLHYHREDSPELTKFWNNIESLKREYQSKIRSLKNSGPDGDAELQKIYLGDYASTNLNEFMAEGFTEYKLYSHPTPYAIKIGKLIDEYFGK